MIFTYDSVLVHMHALHTNIMRITVAAAIETDATINKTSLLGTSPDDPGSGVVVILNGKVAISQIELSARRILNTTRQKIHTFFDLS